MADRLAMERRVEAALTRFFERKAHMRVERMMPVEGKPGQATGTDPFVEFTDMGGEGDINLAEMAIFLIEELNL